MIQIELQQKHLEAKFVEARRDYFLEHLFISDEVRETFDPDETYEIWVIDVMNKRFISLQENHCDRPDVCFVNEDWTIWASSGTVGSDGSRMPHLDMHTGRWYNGDECQQIGNVELKSGEVWWAKSGDPTNIEVYTISKNTSEMINARFFENGC